MSPGCSLLDSPHLRLVHLSCVEARHEDATEIYRLALLGKKPKQIAEELGYNLRRVKLLVGSEIFRSRLAQLQEQEERRASHHHK